MEITEIKEVIRAVATEKCHRNLVVMLRTEKYSVDFEMLCDEIANLAYISVSDRRNKDNSALSKHESLLSHEVRNKLGTGCSNGMKRLLACILDKVNDHDVILVDYVESCLNIAEIPFVVDFVKDCFPDTIFIFTATNDLVISLARNADILYLFDDNWYHQDCSEVVFNNPLRYVCEKGWSSLLNHCMIGLWQDRDGKIFSAIDSDKLSPSDRLIYDLIRKENLVR